MENINKNAVLTFEEKRALTGAAAIIYSYNEEDDTFTIIADERYAEDGRDTDYYDFDDFNVPALAIHCFIDVPARLPGDDEDNHRAKGEPLDYVGQFIVLPF